MTPFQEHVVKWKDCTKCNLCIQRSRIVLARGKIPCEVLFVGEAPGESEDLTGSPFDGPAGRELDQWIARASPTVTETTPELRIGFTNLVACFPAEAKADGTIKPTVNEIKHCRSRLAEFIAICNPRLIVCVGDLSSKHAADAADEAKVKPLWCHIIHPAAALRAKAAQQSMMVRRAVVQLTQALGGLRG